MNFEKIMQNITSGLTGDCEKDIQYLMEQCEKYKDHEMGQEIVRACGRLIFKCVPEDRKAEISRAFNNYLTSWESVLEEASFKQHEKKFDEALAMIEGLIQKFEASGMFSDDQVSEYHCFNEFFEEALYRFHAEPEKDLRRADIPFDEIYMLQGSLLIDLQRPLDAEAALEKALRWNPASAQIAFEHAETAKIRGDMDLFFRRTLDVFRYAFRPNLVARCFRNLGYYFVEKEQWEDAVACFTMSLRFDNESHMAMSELYYIQQKAGRTIPQPTMDELRNIAEKYGFPVGADPDVLGLSYNYGKRFAEQGDADGARYCWQITYELTGDEDIRKMMDELPAGES